MLPWLRHLYGGGRLWVLAFRLAGRLEGLAPLFIWGYPGVRCVSLVGAGLTDYLDLLAAGDVAGEIASLLFEFVWDRRADWDRVDLQELREGSPLLASNGRIAPCSICPVLRLDGQLETRMDAKFRTNLRRSANRTHRAGQVQFENANAATLDEYLASLFRLHEARWNGHGMLAAARLRSFHRDVAPAMLASGLLRMRGARVNGSLAAVQYNFSAFGREYAYLSGFDPEMARWSLGTLLLDYSIRSAAAGGAREFDFLRKAEEFKHLWGAEDRPTYRIELLQASRERVA